MDNYKLPYTIKTGGGGFRHYTRSCLTLATPWTVARQAPLSMGFLRQNTRVGCCFLLQGIFQTQGWNSYLLLCWWILYL